MGKKNSTGDLTHPSSSTSFSMCRVTGDFHIPNLEILWRLWERDDDIRGRSEGDRDQPITTKQESSIHLRSM